MKYIVDIDGTICTYEKADPYKDATPLKGRIKFFNDLHDAGHEIKRTELRMGKPSYDYWIDDKAFNVDDFFAANPTTL